jgi:endonuclease/exonuclease/phosphatase (EEP) superfamily protein YafD
VVLTLSIHTGDTNPPPHPGARLHPPMPQARLALLLCMPPVAALASLAIAALCSPESTAGYAIGSIAGSLPPLLMAAWPLWTLTLWATRRVPARAALLGGLGLLLMGLPSPTPAPRQPDEALVVITNVNAYSGEDAALEAFLARIGADAVVTIEQRGAALDGMVRVADNYDEPLPRPSHATAAYCRTSIDGCAASVTAQIGSATMKMPVAVLRIADTCILGIHAPPPYPRDPTGMEPYITALLDQLSAPRPPCQSDDPVVIAGDLNAVPGSRPHRRLLAAGLADLQANSGIYGLTWPTGAGWPPLPLLRLDHVFVGPQAGARLLQTIRVPGSDHKALVLAVGR